MLVYQDHWLWSRKCANTLGTKSDSGLTIYLCKTLLVIGASLSEPNIDGTAGRFHILLFSLLLLWYNCHPHAAVGRTKYVGLP